MYEYKLLNLNWNQTEASVNALAQEGWRVISMAAGGPVGFEIFTILERQKRSRNRRK
jgi:hypothetical protein